jgi:hypothetical protein
MNQLKLAYQTYYMVCKATITLYKANKKITMFNSQQSKCRGMKLKKINQQKGP